MCVCLSRRDKFYVCLHQLGKVTIPFINGTEMQGYLGKNVRVEGYESKYLSRRFYIIGHLCGIGEHQRLDLTYREASLIAPSGSVNESVGCMLLSKNSLALAKLSIALHVTFTRAHAMLLVAYFMRLATIILRKLTCIRIYICMRMRASD